MKINIKLKLKISLLYMGIFSYKGNSNPELLKQFISLLLVINSISYVSEKEKKIIRN